MPEADLLATFPATLCARYEPRRVLGRGGMGVVIEAQDRVLDRGVAVKLPLPETVDKESVVRLHREAQQLAALPHPHIVRIFESGTCEDLPYLVLELLAGEALDRRVAREPLPVRDAADLLEPILDALDYIHTHGLLHRDIKPANIFMRDGVEPVLIDFGLVLGTFDVTRLTAQGNVVGTCQYLAPELLAGGAFSPRSDLFALAVSFLCAITGKNIHGDPSPYVSGELRIMSSLSTGLYFDEARRISSRAGPLGELLLKALAPDPAERTGSAHEMLEELLEVKFADPRKRPFVSGDAMRARTASVRPGPGAVRAPASAPSVRVLMGGLVGALILASVGFLVRVPLPREEPVASTPAPTVAAAAVAAPLVLTDAQQARLGELHADLDIASSVNGQAFRCLDQLELVSIPLGGDEAGVRRSARDALAKAEPLGRRLEHNLEAYRSICPRPRAVPDAFLLDWLETAYAAFNAWYLTTELSQGLGPLPASGTPAREERAMEHLEDIAELAVEALARLAARPRDARLRMVWQLRRIQSLSRRVQAHGWTPDQRAAVERWRRALARSMSELPAQTGLRVGALGVGALAAELPSSLRRAAHAQLSEMAVQLDRAAEQGVPEGTELRAMASSLRRNLGLEESR